MNNYFENYLHKKSSFYSKNKCMTVFKIHTLQILNSKKY